MIPCEEVHRKRRPLGFLVDTAFPGRSRKYPSGFASLEAGSSRAMGKSVGKVRNRANKIPWADVRVARPSLRHRAGGVSSLSTSTAAWVQKVSSASSPRGRPTRPNEARHEISDQVEPRRRRLRQHKPPSTIRTFRLHFIISPRYQWLL